MEPKPSHDVEVQRAGISDRVASAFAACETAVGGRGAIAAALAHAQPSPAVDAVVASVADPRHDSQPLAEICREAGIPIGELWQLVTDVQRAADQRCALATVSKSLQAVVADLVMRAVPHDVECEHCNGQALPPDRRGVPRVCKKCRGTGTVRKVPDLRRVELCLEMAGLLKRGAGVQVNVQQTNAIVGSIHDQMSVFQRASDRVLSGGRAASPQTAAIIDAEAVEPLPR